MTRRFFTAALALGFALAQVSPASALVSKEGEIKTARPAVPPPSKKARVGKIVLPAMDAEDKKAKGKDVTLEGTVGGRSYYGIGVAYGTDPKSQSSKETWFNLVKDVKFSGVNSIMDLKDGDRVRVVYKELEETKKRILRSVELVQRAPPEPPEEHDDDLEAGPDDG